MKTLKSLYLLLLMITTLCSCQETGNAPKIEKKDIGIQLYSVRDDVRKDFTGTVKALGEIGFTTIETADYKDGMFYGMTPEAFRKEIEAAGMKVLSSHTSKLLESTNPDSVNWDEIWSWWDQCIAAHKAAGMKYVVVSWMPNDLQTLAELKTYCDYYNAIGERCNAQGLRFGYHNHGFEFAKIEDKVMFDYMIENTNPDLVFFQLDVFNLLEARQSPVDYIKKYPGRFEVFHIKDLREIGQSGMIGYDAIFNNMEKSGVKYIIAEVEDYSPGFTVLESIKVSLDYLLVNSFVKENYNTEE
jgi:sugar phosphate isomerase/epimerase